MDDKTVERITNEFRENIAQVIYPELQLIKKQLEAIAGKLDLNAEGLDVTLHFTVSQRPVSLKVDLKERPETKNKKTIN